MKILDLHSVDRDDILFKIEKFITDNFDDLPVKIITGHSKFNTNKLTDVVLKHNLAALKERWVNGGAWIILDNEEF
tara:strand:+ start:193 stop:420 length:228 start_codon:yes stop_codon:yes gene_type:complete